MAGWFILVRRGLLLVWILSILVGAERRPNLEGFYCQGCDCPAVECFSPRCACSLPITLPWAEGALSRLRGRLSRMVDSRLNLNMPILVQLREPEPLAAVAGPHTLGLYRSGVLEINRSLRRSEALAVLAHEFGHAWQQQHCAAFWEMSLSHREGFAEWVSLKALDTYGKGSGQYWLLSNRDPVYGDGLRWYLELERWHGIDAVFEHARSRPPEVVEE